MLNLKRTLLGVAVLAVVMLVITAVASSAPSDFPQGVTVSIPKGLTLAEAARTLTDNGVIRSELLFKIYATMLDRAGVKTGDYLFTKAESALRIAQRLVSGHGGFPLVKITIPEGSDSADITAAIVKSIPSFKKDEFALLARQNEGYLFPETYFWPVNVEPEKVIADMRAQFESKLKPIEEDIRKFGKTREEVIIMASIIEREAKSSTDKRIVADILWKRLADGMPLQVDAPFYYILRKSSAKLTVNDLKIASPYNTYTNAGLTPKPISNPGLSTIIDTITPTKTTYWYFLSGKDGLMHYANNLDGHVANKYKYLD